MFKKDMICPLCGKEGYRPMIMDLEIYPCGTKRWLRSGEYEISKECERLQKEKLNGSVQIKNDEQV